MIKQKTDLKVIYTNKISSISKSVKTKQGNFKFDVFFDNNHHGYYFTKIDFFPFEIGEPASYERTVYGGYDYIIKFYKPKH
jgi:hypothetical protein|tara:strand:+ start:1027 stop:1269 length:243 start_codon:yes stop_codon:yes gene_type:complete